VLPQFLRPAASPQVKRIPLDGAFVNDLHFDVGNVDLAISSLSPEMDEAFVRLYAARLGGGILFPTAFDSAATAFLSGTTDFALHDRYFANFTPLWNMHLRAGNFRNAESIWPWALRPVESLEARGGPRIHKGSAYYFWGMTALLADDIDRGYLLMHRGIQEDVITHGCSIPQTPGFALATLDDQKPDQAFRSWVQQQASALTARVDRYNKVHHRTFDLPSLRTRLLSLPDLREAAFLFSYALARSKQLLALPEPLWQGPFPAQVAFDVIFDFCLVVDAAIHHRNPGTHHFIVDAAHLAQRAGLALSQQDLGLFNGMFQANFKNTLLGVLNESQALPGQQPATGMAAALLATYGCRNRGAHSVSFFDLDPGTFDALVDRLVHTLCLTVETLY
jgi:hypothetical protein